MFGKKKADRTTVTLTARTVKREFVLPGATIPGTEVVVPADRLGMTFGSKETLLVIVDTPERLKRMFELEAAMVEDLCVLTPVAAEVEQPTVAPPAPQPVTP